MTDGTICIIAFLVHSVLFAVALFFIFVNPSLLDNQNYMNIVYILLSTLLIHGGYHLGKNSKQ
jgi:uncharacterized membrane protein